jgi:hypothetical protein
MIAPDIWHSTRYRGSMNIEHTICMATQYRFHMVRPYVATLAIAWRITITAPRRRGWRFHKARVDFMVYAVITQYARRWYHAAGLHHPRSPFASSNTGGGATHGAAGAAGLASAMLTSATVSSESAQESPNNHASSESLRHHGSGLHA